MLDRAAVLAELRVSRETEALLDGLVASLIRWQTAKNLVGPRTLDEVWTRHILDSAQLTEHIPPESRVVDLGSGAGFPGLVFAILRKGVAGSHVSMVESNGRKCAFLREMIRTLGLQASVSNARIESVLPEMVGKVDVVTARALASLTGLFELTNELLKGPVTGVFPKGQDVADELTEAAKYWTFDASTVASRTDSKARIVLVREVRRKSLTAS
ncbi:16S rRNA (guanine(527)-N(7))-methyltransferase RsmG [Alsobacter sp. KACC 23698]|uniref:Ribosomal RNA small subunit methyltransferase G n=1 Tax=Alsobacter sp. KACC 23698 TaxID=3149229 RepID=A0AAU7JEF0_9HYPH